jgi:hypothetical protein
MLSGVFCLSVDSTDDPEGDIVDFVESYRYKHLPVVYCVFHESMK